IPAAGPASTPVATSPEIISASVPETVSAPCPATSATISPPSRYLAEPASPSLTIATSTTAAPRSASASPTCVLCHSAAVIPGTIGCRRSLFRRLSSSPRDRRREASLSPRGTFLYLFEHLFYFHKLGGKVPFCIAPICLKIKDAGCGPMSVQLSH